MKAIISPKSLFQERRHNREYSRKSRKKEKCWPKANRKHSNIQSFKHRKNCINKRFSNNSSEIKRKSLQNKNKNNYSKNKLLFSLTWILLLFHLQMLHFHPLQSYLRLQPRLWL